MSEHFYPRVPKRPEEMGPLDCPDCRGAGGRRVPSGCFGSTGFKCKRCRGKGTISKEQLAHETALAEAENLLSATKMAAHGVVAMAQQWARDRSPQSEAELSAAVRGYNEKFEICNKFMAEHADVLNDYSWIR